MADETTTLEVIRSTGELPRMLYTRPITFVDEKLDDGSANPAFTSESPRLRASNLNSMQDQIGAEVDSVRADTNAALAGKAASNHGHSIGDVSGLQAALDAKASARSVPITPVTGTTHTAAVGQAGGLTTHDNAAANTHTIPANVFAAGDTYRIMQIGAGQTSIAPGTGLTLDSEASMRKIAARYTSVTVTFLSATRAILEGSLSA